MDGNGKNKIILHFYSESTENRLASLEEKFEKRKPGEILRQAKFDDSENSACTDYETKGVKQSGKLSANGAMLTVLNGLSEKDLVASVGANSDAEAGLVLRLHDVGNYVAAIYSPKQKAIYLLDRKNGEDGHVQE